MRVFFLWFPKKCGHFSIRSAYQLTTGPNDDLFAAGLELEPRRGSDHLELNLAIKGSPKEEEHALERNVGRSCYHDLQGFSALVHTFDLHLVWCRGQGNLPCIDFLWPRQVYLGKDED